MEQQFTAYTGPSIEEVQQRFERWRDERKRGAPIPAALWEDAVRLCADHSLCKISSALHLDYNVLKRRVCYSHPERLPESVMSSAFVELDLKASLPEAECLFEMEDKDGAKMKMHIKGRLCLDPLEYMKAFLGQGR